MSKKLSLIVVILLLSIGVLVGCGSDNKDTEGNSVKKEENYTPVNVEDVKKKTLFNVSTFSGKIKADKEVMILPKIVGKVESIKGEVGDKVNKGDILFTLEKDDIQKKVKQAKVAYEGAKANFELTKEKIDNAQKNFQRTKELYEQGAATKAQYEQAKIAASNNSLEAAKTQVEQAKVTYQQALDAIDNTNISSPISGVISMVNIEEGEFATNTQPSMTIVNANKVYVEINVTEDIINEIYKGMEVNIDIPSVPLKDVTGKINTVSPSVNQRIQLYPVKIYVDNENGKIKPGMFSKVDIKTNVREDVISVKSEAVVKDEGEDIIYIVEENRAVRRKVKTGLDTGEYIEIVEGVNEGEKVIVKGQNYTDEGEKVKIIRGE
ncbi:efflux RND transporter periplasmic adaptor subunit [Dethiothermospora halolimnae]|uniref:efflux RND transporter periplasmic adaptor subunit n=1 Tax=Dethiothermospora halolimnae TaxID=3114390 RepID=UPI003CCBA536